MRAVVLGSVLVVVLAGARVAADGTVLLPAPSGVYGVGRASYELVDLSREELATPEPGDAREVMVEVWYPSQVATTAGWSPYFLNHRAAQFNALFNRLPSAFFDDVRARSQRRVAAWRGEHRWPVVLFSPGLQAPATYVSHLAEEIASHGYVVIGVVHPYSSGVTVLSGGRIAFAPDMLDRIGIERLHEVWVEDMRFVLDRLEDIGRQVATQTGGALELDATRVAAIGHSLGGSAAATLAGSDGRISAAVNVDGTFVEPVGGPIAQPFMLINSDSKIPDPSRGSFLERLRGPGFNLTLIGSGHNNFTDAGMMFGLLQRVDPSMTLDRAQLGPIDGERALRITGAYLRAFLNRYLLNADEPLLDGPSALYPELVFEPINPADPF